MNILFVSIDGDSTYVGGTATIVQLMAGWLQEHGHFCALGYFEEGRHPATFFEYRLWLHEGNLPKLKEFNEEHPLDILYVTQCINIDWRLLRRCFPSAKLIAAYHSRPMLMCPPRRELKVFLHGNNSWITKAKVAIYMVLYPFYKHHTQLKEKRGFENLAANCDALQLLSKGFVPVFKKIVPQFDDKKIFCIGNPVVWRQTIDEKEITRKERNVLVVCNANHQKRAYLMIEAWRLIEQDETLSDWTFTFVGDSREVQLLKTMAKEKYKLERITFVGRQKPLEYYRRGRIFLMTSAFEGWPMVLMESMQMGCVPIVFDSFESIYDIIQNRENGIIVRNNDMDAYVEQLKLLMNNKEECRRMGRNATLITQRYSIDSIMQRYMKEFEKLTAKNKL